MESNTTCTTNRNYRIAAALYIPQMHGLFQEHNCKQPSQEYVNNNNNNNNNNNIGATGTISKSFRKYVRNIPRNMKSRNYRKQPYWALHTYFGKQ